MSKNETDEPFYLFRNVYHCLPVAVFMRRFSYREVCRCSTTVVGVVVSDNNNYNNNTTTWMSIDHIANNNNIVVVVVVIKLELC